MLLFFQDVMDYLNECGIPVFCENAENLPFSQIQWFDSPWKMEKQTLYIRARYRQGQQQGTALILETELLLIEDCEAEYVLEMLMRLSDMYSQWENRLIQAVLHQENLGSFFLIASEVFSCPVFLTDSNGELVEFSDPTQADLSNIRNFLQVRDSMFPLSHAIGDNLIDFRDSTPDVEYHILVAELWYGQQCLGMLHFYHFRGKVHEGVIHRIEEIAKLTGSYLAVNADRYFSVSYISSIMKDICHGRFNDWERFRQELRAVGWTREQQLQVIAIGRAPDTDILDEARELLRSRNLCCYFVREDDMLILLCNASESPRPEQTICNLMRREALQLSVGISSPVRSLRQLPVYYRQAIFALNIALERKLPLFLAKDAALQAFRQVLLENQSLSGLIHPDLERLQAYDLAHGTYLMETLIHYLSCGCRYDVVASELDMHPNTVRYRLRKISELIESNLYDPASRENLLLSLLLLQ